MSNLSAKSVVVTGASGGLGGAVIEALLEADARLFVPVMEADLPKSLGVFADRLTVFHGVDVTDESSVRGVYGEITDLWGSVHLVGGFSMASIEETTLSDLDRMWKMNAVSCFVCCREAIRHIRSSGRIVNVTARPAIEPAGGMSAYTMSKAAVAALTRSLAVEARSRGINVNAIVPSIIDTPANRATMPDAPHESWPKPEQIAKTVEFLLSEAGELTSGALVPVYGRV